MTSNGMLLNLDKEARAAEVKRLPLSTKIKLAHIATLGAGPLFIKAEKWRAKGNEKFYNEVLQHAKDLIALAAELTNTDDEPFKKSKTHEEVVTILKDQALETPEEGWLSDMSHYALEFDKSNVSINTGYGSIDIGHLASVVTEIINN